MKLFMTLSISFLLFVSTNVLSQEQTHYQIKQIKRDHNWFIIIASRHDSLFKIVSQKAELPFSECDEIKVGKYYDLRIQSIIPIINGVKMWPVNYLDFGGIKLDDKTVVNIDPESGIFDIYWVTNLKGLYLIKQ